MPGEDTIMVPAGRGTPEETWIITAASGLGSSRIPLSILECLQIALDDEKLTSMVINPYGNCFIMDKETIKGFLNLIQSE